MPFISTADEWLTLSAQLLEARPTTTRITTRYRITASKARKTQQRSAQRQQQQDGADADTPMPDAASKPPRGKLIIKTFCAHSGVCLKYKTCKAQEVGRLVQMLGSLGRNMSGMPAAPVAAAAPAPAEEDVGVSGTATPPVAPPAGAVAGGGAEGGKGKKKKKGKR